MSLAAAKNNAEQREASMTSADWLRIIKAVIQNIDKAIAQYSSWRPTANRLETAKPLITMLSYIAHVVRSKLESDGPQPVVQSEPKISLEVLLGWLHLKARLEGVDIEKMKQLLFEFAEVEHQLIRFKQMVDKAESIGVAELNEQEQIDKNVILKILLKIQQEAVATKTALFPLVVDGLLPT